MSKSLHAHIKEYLVSLKVGTFLALRDITHANKWTTGLIVFVMTLTFLTLVVISGILVGLIEGSSVANQRYYTGDIIISPYANEGYIKQSQDVI